MSDSLQHLSTSELGERFAAATSSEDAARIAAELEQRARHLAATDRYFSSPLSLAPPAVRAGYGPAERLELANYCGPHDAHTVPMDTGREHGPIAERVRHRDTGRRGWLLASSGRGELSLVLWRSATSEPARTSWHPTTATRLGWLGPCVTLGCPRRRDATAAPCTYCATLAGR